MPDVTDAYLRDAVMTATPEQLYLMLCDGAIRFTRSAIDALRARDWEGAFNGFNRAQRILIEMTNSLNYNVDAELCKRMAALYSFMYRKLVQASVDRDTAVAEEVIGLLEYQRETWLMVMDRLRQERETATPSSAASADAETTRTGPNPSSRPATALRRPPAPSGSAPPPPSPSDEPLYGQLSVEG